MGDSKVQRLVISVKLIIYSLRRSSTQYNTHIKAVQVTKNTKNTSSKASLALEKLSKYGDKQYKSSAIAEMVAQCCTTRFFFAFEWGTAL